MFFITYRNDSKEEAQYQNDSMCESMKGWSAFINDEVVVSPVKKYGDKYGFNVYVGPENPNQKSAPWIEVFDIDEVYKYE